MSESSVARNAIDGSLVALETAEEHFPGLQIDLSTQKEIGSVETYYKSCPSCADHLHQLEIRAGNDGQSGHSGEITANNFCGHGPTTSNLMYYSSEQQAYHQIHVTCSQPIFARYVTVQLMTTGSLSIHEIKIFEPTINGKIYWYSGGL